MTWQDIGEQGARKYLGGEWVIYRSKTGTYSAADQAGWLPGIYADEAAARQALEIAQTQHGALAEAVHWTVRGQGDDYRPMTLAELDALAPASDGET